MNLKRDIKGRREDLSPWLAVLGLYNKGKYESYVDKIRLERKSRYKIKRTIKKQGETEIIENEIEENLSPSFFIDIEQNNTNINIFYKKNLCEVSYKKDGTEDEDILIEKKEEIIEKVKTFLGVKQQNKENLDVKKSNSL